MGVNKRLKAGVVLGVGDLPGKPPKNHTQENDGDAPDVRLSGIIIFSVEDLWSEIRIAANDTGGWCMCLAGIVEDSCSTEIDEFNDVVGCHDAIVELEVTMSKTHLMEVFNAITNLAEYAIDLWSAHLSRHDNAEKVERSIFHDLIIVAMVRYNIDGLDDIGVFQGGTNAELCGDLLLIFSFCLTGTFRAEFLDSEDTSAVLGTSLDQANGPTSTATKNTTPFTILLGEMCVGSILKR